MGMFLSDERLEEVWRGAKSYPFASDDWGPAEYDHPIASYNDTRCRRIDLRRNIRLASGMILPTSRNLAFRSRLTWWKRIRHAARLLVYVDTDRPDATLKKHTILCVWGEDADYLQYMDPATVLAITTELAESRGLLETFEKNYEDMLNDVTLSDLTYGS